MPGDIPKTVERYVKEHKDQGMSEEKAWAVAWSRYCVTGHTLIPTGNGLKCVKRLYEEAKDQIIHSDGTVARKTEIKIASKNGLSLTSHVIYTGKKSVLKTETKHGYSLTCTPDHQILVLNEKDYSTEWVKAEDAVGRYAILPIQNIWGSKVSLPKFNYRRKASNNVVPLKKPTKITPELARMLGYLVAEGAVTDEGVEFSNTNPDLIKDFVECSINVFGEKPCLFWQTKDNEDWKDCCKVRLRTRWYREFFTSLGLAPSVAQNKKIPFVILSAPKIFVKEFLRGFIEGDGYTGDNEHKNRIDLTTSSKVLAKQLHLLLLNFGIPSTLESNKRGYFNVRIHSKIMALKYQKEIGTVFKKVAISKSRQRLRGSEFEMIPAKSILKIGSKVRTAFPGSKRISLSRISRNWNVFENYKDSNKIVNNLKILTDKNYFFDKIISIKSLNPVDVFDLTVPEDRSFVANGFIAHNCEYKYPDSPRCKKDDYFEGRKSSTGEITWRVPDHFDPYDFAEEMGIRPDSTKEFTAAIKEGNRIVAVLFTGYRGGTYGFDIVVHPDYQRKGYGSELMDLAIEEYEDLLFAIPDLQFHLDAVNPVAVKMLKQRGFEVTQKHQGHTYLTKTSSQFQAPPQMRKRITQWAVNTYCGHVLASVNEEIKEDQAKYKKNLHSPSYDPHYIEDIRIREFCKKYTNREKKYKTRATKRFDINLRGWRYLKDLGMTTEEVLDKIWWDDKIRVFLHFSDSSKAMRGRGEGGVWKRDKKEIHISTSQFHNDVENVKDNIEIITETINHELQHMAQSLMESIRDHIYRPGDGHPSDNLLDISDEESERWDEAPSYALDKIRYFTDPEEFYPQIDTWATRFIQYTKSYPPKLRRRDMKIYVGEEDGPLLTPEEKSSLENTRGLNLRTFRGPADFFDMLKKYNKKLWKKAVKEFYKRLDSKGLLRQAHIKDYPKKASVPEKYEHIDFKPPKSVADAAKKGLEYREKQESDKAGLTQEEANEEGIGSGVQRAVNLKNRDNISPEVIKQMHGFFSRHEKNKSIDEEHEGKPWEDNGYVSWLLWGGDPGQKWVEKIMKQMEKADEKAKKAARIARRVLQSTNKVEISPERKEQEKRLQRIKEENDIEKGRKIKLFYEDNSLKVKDGDDDLKITPVPSFFIELLDELSYWNTSSDHVPVPECSEKEKKLTSNVLNSYLKNASISKKIATRVFISENVPTDEKLWDRVIKLTKGEIDKIEEGGKTIEAPNEGKGFDVYPSAYANGWAVQRYEELGGGWKTKKESRTTPTKELIEQMNQHLPGLKYDPGTGSFYWRGVAMTLDQAIDKAKARGMESHGMNSINQSLRM